MQKNIFCSTVIAIVVYMTECTVGHQFCASIHDVLLLYIHIHYIYIYIFILTLMLD